MAKHYEAPNVIELGLAEDVVLGMKVADPPDNGNDLEFAEISELIDRDE